MQEKNITINLLNFFIGIFPLTFILGNLATNINIIFIVILGFFFLKIEIFKRKKEIFYFLLYLFFFYIILITFINNFSFSEIQFNDYKTFIKSLSYLRYLMFFLVINHLVEKKLLDLRFFTFFSIFLVTLLSIDIIYQVIIGKNFLDFPIVQNRPSGFFGDETIAGGYIQKFSLIIIFFLIYKEKYFFLKNKPILKFFLLLVIILFFFITILLTNNRMSLVIFIFTLISYLIITKYYKFLFSIIIAMIIMFSLFLKNNDNARNSYNTFYKRSVEIIFLLPKLVTDESFQLQYKGTDYILLFNGGIEVWKKNIFFGNGIKSYRKNCKNTYGREVCSTHPHNYNLEILDDTGLIGLMLIYLIFYIPIYKNFKIFFLKPSKLKINNNYLNLIFVLILFFEIFPFRSTGSFFSTSNSTLIFMFLSFIVNSKNYKINDIKKINTRIAIKKI